MFWTKLMNWLDLLAIIPYYMGLLLTLYKNTVIVGWCIFLDKISKTIRRVFNLSRERASITLATFAKFWNPAPPPLNNQNKHGLRPPTP